MQIKKATGVDKLSCNIINLGKPVLPSPLTGLINLSIQTPTFPGFLKQVTPLDKKKNTMNKSNFRPVSILTSISKLYEKVFSEQLSQYFEDISDNYLCAFRNGQGCRTTLLRLLEDWKQALDKYEYVAALQGIWRYEILLHMFYYLLICNTLLSERNYKLVCCLLLLLASWYSII